MSSSLHSFNRVSGIIVECVWYLQLEEKT